MSDCALWLVGTAAYTTWTSGYPPAGTVAGSISSRPALSAVAALSVAVTLSMLGATQLAPEGSQSGAATRP